MAHPFRWTDTGKPTTKLPPATFRPAHRRTRGLPQVKTAKQALS